MEDNVKSFLDKIQELKETKNKVHVLSTGKKVDSSPISFKQQKELIGTIADGVLGTLKLQKILNDIVTTNTGNNELKVTDKLPIILKLRIDSIGSVAKVDETDINLEELLAKAVNLKFNTTKTISDKLDVVLEVPSIQQESKVIQAAIETIKRDGEGELGKNIGSIYTYEIIKYIKSIKFDDQELVFQEIPIKDRFKVVENLPVAINKEIVKFVQDLKKTEQEVMTVSIDDSEKLIEIDVSFFDS